MSPRPGPGRSGPGASGPDRGAPERAGGTATPSLARRVTLAVLGLLVILLLVVGVTVDLLLGAQMRRDLHDRLAAGSARADAASRAGVPAAELVRQSDGGTVRALLITPDGRRYGDETIDPAVTDGPTDPLPPPAPAGPADPMAPGGPGTPGEPGGPGAGPGPPGPPDATATALVHELPARAGRLVLVADTTQLTAVTRELREVMVVAGLITVALAAVALLAVSRGALRPLDRLTALAREITSGDRGRRLHPDRDATDLGRAASAFDGMLDALESAEARATAAAADSRRAAEQTRRFLSDAAHELRTPLAGIQAVTESLRTHQDPAATTAERRRLELLHGETRRAARLVGDMLDIARIDAGVGLRREPTDLVALAEAEVERAAVLAPRLTVTRTGSATAAVHADPGRVGQVLANLLDNARRYTPPGGTVTVHVDGTTPGVVEVTVTDTGPGVPEADRERIFQRLVRLDESRDRDRGGSGLGLAIARALALAHGGELSCEAPPDGSGARFRLVLPSAGPTDQPKPGWLRS